MYLRAHQGSWETLAKFFVLVKKRLEVHFWALTLVALEEGVAYFDDMEAM